MHKKYKFNYIPHLLSLTLMLSFLGACNFKMNQEHPQVTKGKALYGKYCVECHDVSGKGIKELRAQFNNVDLTTINSRRNVDEFPVMEIAKYIDGRAHYKEIGPRPMPMWGVDMVALENEYNPDTARTNLGAIISYIITLQEQ